MPDGQVAACDDAPACWPPGTYTIVRRVTIAAKDISTDPQGRRRRTIPEDQLTLALGGQLDHVGAVSFIVTNIPANHGDDVGLEAWFRRRTSIEDRFREAKHGACLIHLPSASKAVNAAWMWAGLLAGAFAVMLPSITGLDRQPHDPGRVRIATLRHQLLAIPGRLTTHARTPVLRLQPGHRLLHHRAGPAASASRADLTPGPTPPTPTTEDRSDRPPRRTAQHARHQQKINSPLKIAKQARSNSY